jgi:ribosomal protein S6
VLVTRPSLSEADRKNLLTSVKEWLKDVKVIKEEDLGQKPLSYKIKKEVAGVYQMLHLETETSVPTDFEKRLIHTDAVIRHLLVRTK